MSDKISNQTFKETEREQTTPLTLAVPTSPAEEKPLVTADWASAVIAVIAVFLSALSYKKSAETSKKQEEFSRKTFQYNEFNQKFGAPLRSQLRKLDTELKTLRVLLTPSYKNAPLAEKQKHIESNRTSWELATHDVLLLLGETAECPAYAHIQWTDQFSNFISTAEAHLDSIGNPSRIKCSATFEKAGKLALKSYEDAIKEARKLIHDLENDFRFSD